MSATTSATLILKKKKKTIYHPDLCNHRMSVFGSVIAGTFQITFRTKIYANNVFLFFKNHLTSAHQNDPKHTNHIKF